MITKDGSFILPLLMFHSQCQIRCAIPATESDTRPRRPVRRVADYKRLLTKKELEWDGRERCDSQRGRSWAEVPTRQPPIPSSPKSVYTNLVEETILACMPSPQIYSRAA